MFFINFKIALPLRFFLVFLIPLCNSNAGYTQPPAAFVKMGMESIEAGNWQLAFGYYQQAYELDTSDFDIKSKYALAAFYVKRYDLSEKLFTANYSKDNGAIDPDALYWIASIEKLNGKYEDAQRNFKKFIKKHKSKADKNLIEKAEHEVKSAVWAMEHNSDDLINTPMAGMLRCDEWGGELKALKTTSNYESTASPYFHDGRFFFSGYREGVWSIHEVDAPNRLRDQIQEGEKLSKLPSEFASVSNPCVFGEQLFFTTEMNGFVSIYSADKTENGWSNYREITELNESGTNNTMPHVTLWNNKTVMIFSSDREEGEGGMDLWISEFDEGWSKPKSAGKKINSPGDEIAPFLYQGNLLFSSNWHYGYGGYDLFLAKKEGAVFGSPENCGRLLNSTYNEMGVAFRAVDESPELVLTSNRKSAENENEYCCNKLYFLDWIRLKSDSINGSPSDRPEDLIRTLPVVLYFHNDEPNPRTLDTTTTTTYGEAYRSYVKLIPKYLDENRKGLTGEKKEDAETITLDFFEMKVNAGMRDLSDFSECALKELEAGKSLRISVRGFASPRAESDYNLNLTKRRTASLVNEMLADSNGIFKPYIEGTAINGAKLEFMLLPFGEYKADAAVSDDLMDERNSIYSRSASLERKIEITKVEYFTPVKFGSGLQLDNEHHDFGLIPWFGEVTHDFELKNSGNEIMRIDSVVAECGCTIPLLEKSELKPGESTLLHVGFNPISKQGIQEKLVFIYVHGEEPKVLSIKAERSK